MHLPSVIILHTLLTPDNAWIPTNMDIITHLQPFWWRTNVPPKENHNALISSSVRPDMHPFHLQLIQRWPSCTRGSKSTCFFPCSISISSAAIKLLLLCSLSYFPIRPLMPLQACGYLPQIWTILAHVYWSSCASLRSYLMKPRNCFFIDSVRFTSLCCLITSQDSLSYVYI